MKLPLSLLFVLCTLSITRAEKENSPAGVTFTKHQLHVDYISEGATITDLDGDGNADIVAGPLWWKGLDFKNKFAFAPYQSFPLKGAKPILKNYATNFFSFPDELTGDKWTDLIQIGIAGKPAHLIINPAARTWPADTKHDCAECHTIHKRVCHESPQYLNIIGDQQKELLFFAQGRIALARPTQDHRKLWETLYISDASKPKKPFVHGLGAGDVNGDNLQDILEKDGWWEQPKDWDQKTLWKFHPFPFAPKKGGAQMYAYDFNGDGHNDIVTALDAHGYGLVWYEQIKKDESITFKQHIIMAKKHEKTSKRVSFSQLHALLCEDIDGDGIKDLITGKTYYAHLGKDPGAEDPAVIYWFKTQRNKNKTVEFIPHLIDDNSGIGRQISIGDLNRDQKPDIVTSNKKGVFVFIQN